MWGAKQRSCNGKCPLSAEAIAKVEAFFWSKFYPALIQSYSGSDKFLLTADSSAEALAKVEALLA